MVSTPAEREALVSALGYEVRHFIAETILLFDKIGELFGLNSTDVQCLNILQYTGPLPAGKLAELLGLTTGAVTGVIDRLEKGGYVRRERDPHDRRRVIIQPQSLQAAELNLLLNKIAHSWDTICTPYSNQELELLLGILRKTHSLHKDTIAYLHQVKRSS